MERIRTHFHTSELANAVGIHPNTVRLYEKWGLIPPVGRTSKGYRIFTQFHLDCLQIARLVFSAPYAGPMLRRSSTQVVMKAAARDLGGALELTYQHQALVQFEKSQAEAAARLLERWAKGAAADSTQKNLRIGETADLLGVTVDTLRNWERNGLLKVPRDPHNGYRSYGSTEIGRLRVIRMLARAGYSTMAILRMMLQLDAGITDGLLEVLDTPRLDEDVYSASDRWLSTLTEQEHRTERLILYLEEMIRKSQKEG